MLRTLKFIPLPLSGAYLIELEPRRDDRGFYARAFCLDEFADQGLVSTFVQMNDIFSSAAGTLRGLHYQKPPRAETKLIRVVRGALFDVIVDLRPESPMFCRSYGIELTADDRRAIYVPKGFAHGLLTLADDTELLYLVDERHAPAAEAGIRWNDPALNIVWPRNPTLVSDRDRSFPAFDRAAFLHHD